MQSTHTASTGSPSSILDATLAAASRRLTLQRMMRFGGRALCWSSLPCVLVIGASKLHWVATPSPAVIGGVIGAALLAAIIWSLTRPLTQIDVARVTERNSDMKERLSSALEFRSLGVSDEPFYAEQLADAGSHAGAIKLKTVLPFKMPWELPVGVLCTLIASLTFFLPTLPVFWSPQHKQEAAEVKRRGIEIEKVASEAEKAAQTQKLDETHKAAAEAKKLGEQMRKGKVEKKEALVALAKLTKKMEDTQKRLAQPTTKKSLAEAHKDFQKALDKLNQEKKDEAGKNGEDPKKKLANADPKDIKKPGDKSQQTPKPSEAMKQMKQAMQQMADALANSDPKQMQQAMSKMAQQMSKGEMSKEEMKQTAQALQQLAQSLKDTNQQDAAQQMQQMAEQMQQGNMSPESMQQAAGMMNKIGQQMAKGGSMQSELDGKSLAELAQQLQNGKLTQMLGKNAGMQGNQPGKGYYGSGGKSDAMKDPGATSPRLIAMGKANTSTAKGKQGSAQEFAQYLSKSSGAPKHLPNGKINGTRSQNGNELSMTMTGDPTAARSSSPYYAVVQTSKKQAESTLDKENIPASLKKQVKDYFDSIKP